MGTIVKSSGVNLDCNEESTLESHILVIPMSELYESIIYRELEAALFLKDI